MRRMVLTALMIAAGLSAMSAHAAQNDPRLTRLFEALKAAQSQGQAHALENQIGRIWAESADPQTQRLMRQGLTLMAAHDRKAALKAFDDMVAHEPDFAEGWNKRATLEFLLGDYKASMADIAHTLKLEPRHFGALAGLGQVELSLGNKQAALDAFTQALALDPYLGDLSEIAERLKKELAGKPI